MEPLWILFTATGVYFWLLILLASIGIIFSLEKDAPGWATTTCVGAIIVAWFFSDSVHYVTRWDWRWMVTIVALYVLVGVCWSLIKWFFELQERKAHWKELLAEFKESKGLPREAVIKPGYPGLMEWLQKGSHYDFLQSANKYGTGNPYVMVRPKPNKSRNIARMAYWPWSMLWTLLDDFFYGLFRHVYNLVAGAYDSMGRYVFRGLDD